MKEKIYGIADKAWQPVIGCDPRMPCAKRCWARKTVARIVECQQPVSPERAAFYQIALTPDKQRWSGEVRLDEAHLHAPLRWRKPALIATGFHGDLGRLSRADLDRVFGVIGLCQMFRAVHPLDFLLLTKCPANLLEYLSQPEDDLAVLWGMGAGTFLDGEWIWKQGKHHRERVEAFVSAGHGFYPDGENMLEEDAFPVPLENVSIGCSVMSQADANAMREPMAAIAALGWATHVWYEPALGPVDWIGWEFLGGIIAGGESGKDSRPSHPQWHRNTRDWCVAHGVPFNFKQHGDWRPLGDADMGSDDWDAPAVMEANPEATVRISLNGRFDDGNSEPTPEQEGAWMVERVGKRAAGRLLDGRTWDGVPRFAAFQAREERV